MSECTLADFSFPSFDRRKIEAGFTGGDVSSDGGVMLLRQADRRIGLTRAVAGVLQDRRDPALITHALTDLLRCKSLMTINSRCTSCILPSVPTPISSEAGVPAEP